MKKLLLISLSFIAIGVLSAQNCTPDAQYTDVGVYPDSATNMAPAYVGTPYAEVITVITPVDTCVEVIPGFPCQDVPIDSIVVESVTGLPAGFSIMAEYQTDLNFAFPGGVTSCMIIQGTAIPGQEGVYPVTVAGTSYATVLGLTQTQPYNVDYYSITVLPALPTGLASFDKNVFEVGQNMPNPFSSNSTIEYNMPNSGNVLIQVRNVIGELVVSDNVAAQAGVNKFQLDGSKLTSGIYFYQFNYNNKVITKKFIVNK